MTRVAGWQSSFLDLLVAYAPAGWCGRTSPVSCQSTRGTRYDPSLTGWRNWGIFAISRYLMRNFMVSRRGAGGFSYAVNTETIY